MRAILHLGRSQAAGAEGDPRLDALLSRDSYGEIAYEIAAPGRGLILEILARAGIKPDELN